MKQGEEGMYYFESLRNTFQRKLARTFFLNDPDVEQPECYDY